MTKLLEIKDLKVSFPTDDGEVRAVDGIDLTLSSSETVAIVGESGSGKTVTSLSILGLHNRASTNLSGQILVSTETGFVDVVSADEKDVRGIRGKDAAMIFQDPMSSLHPYYSISNQLSEAFRIHNQVSKKAAHARSVEMLELVGIPEPAKRANEYPHQFSGGMRQRVMIAMALINNPKILIADEPTTALDVTVQAQILLLLKELQKEFKMGILLITHDLGVVAGVADRVNVMYAGKIVESGLVDEIYYSPAAPYTMGLLSSIPSVYGKGTGRLSAIPGQPPSLINLPTGCSFEPRCSLKSLVKSANCATDKPQLVEDERGHFARCHLDLETRRAEGKKVAAKGVK